MRIESPSPKYYFPLNENEIPSKEKKKKESVDNENRRPLPLLYQNVVKSSYKS